MKPAILALSLAAFACSHHAPAPPLPPVQHVTIAEGSIR